MLPEESLPPEPPDPEDAGSARFDASLDFLLLLCCSESDPVVVSGTLVVVMLPCAEGVEDAEAPEDPECE